MVRCLYTAAVASFARRVLGEPFLHFVLLGAALFLVDRATSSQTAERAPVVVDAEIRAGLETRLSTAQGRPPTEAELEAAVDRWRDEEVLYREGLARGLDAGDPLIRERIAQKMARVIRDGLIVPEPSDEQLRSWFELDRSRWSRDARYDFTHVFVAGHDAEAEVRARSLLEALAEGSSPNGLGDRFRGGRRYRQRSLEQLESAFGASFVEGLPSQPAGAWMLRRSRHGLHLVRIDGRAAATSPAFEAVKLDVRAAWEEAQREEAFRRAMQELRAQWSG